MLDLCSSDLGPHIRNIVPNFGKPLLSDNDCVPQNQLSSLTVHRLDLVKVCSTVGNFAKWKLAFFPLFTQYCIINYKNGIGVLKILFGIYLKKKTANTRALNLLISRFNLASVTP